MIRRCVTLQCAAAATPAAAAAAPAPKAPAAKNPQLQWQRVRIPAWRQQSQQGVSPAASAVFGASAVATPPLDSFYLLGQHVGPRPLLVLNTAVTSSDDGPAVMSSLQKWETMLSALNWRFGCVSVPAGFGGQMPSSGTNGAPWLSMQLDRVLRLLDSLNVGWTHCIGHGSGALLAAALAVRAPDRVGSIVSLDSPLLSREWLAKEKARKAMALAAMDVNVPGELLAMHTEELTNGLEAPLPCVVAASASSSSDGSGGGSPAARCAEQRLFDEYLFAPTFLFGPAESATRGLAPRNDSRYLSASAVAGIRHPLMLVSPSSAAAPAAAAAAASSGGGKAAAPAEQSAAAASSSAAVADAALHKEVFAIRRSQPIKSAKSHADLFAPAAAEEVAAMVGQWVTRFEPEVVVNRRVEQALKDTKAKFASLNPAEPGVAPGGAAAPAAAAAGGGKGGKKKDGGGGDKGKEKKKQ